MGPPTRRLQDDEIQVRKAREAEKEILDKDEVELRLEKMLFGDEAGFLNSLTEPKYRAETTVARVDDPGDVLDHVPDVELDDAFEEEELFFLDTSTAKLPQPIASELRLESEQEEQHKRPPVWADSDDERLTVSLAADTRLRKLRDTEDDDIVTGTEYIRRLRRQYERLHPPPEWVKYAYKKRRLAEDRQDSDSESDISVDDQPLLSSAQPLSELLRATDGFTRTDAKDTNGSRQRRLRPEVVDIQRLKDVVSSGPSSIDTMQFHPYFPLLLSAGPSSTVNLYHISPQPPNPNPLVTSLHLKNTPLHTAAFCRSLHRTSSDTNQSRDETRIFMSSRRRYFHTWSLTSGKIQKVSRPIYGSGRRDQKTMESFKLSPCGKFMGLVGSGRKGGGTINILSSETMQWICACRIDSQGGVADFAWWSNGNGFVVVGKNGEASEYDIELKTVVMRWTDEGAVGTTVIAIGGETGNTNLGGNRWVAVGSSSGVVNVYDRKDWAGGSGIGSQTTQRPKPTRAFDQLTTPTSHLEFSSDGQMLVMGSRWKRDALRLIHLPSCTVYRNWPTDKTPLGRVSSIAMSLDGGYLAVANEQGKIRLFQIRD